MRLRAQLWIAGLFLMFAGTTAPAQEMTTVSSEKQSRFQQDEFAIGFWVDPPADERMEDRYREIAEANFSLVVGGFGAKRKNEIERQVQLCEQFGLKLLAGVPQRDLERLATSQSPALWGYLWNDEPIAREFLHLAAHVQEIRKRRPGKLAFINLYPNYAGPAAFGTNTYEEYVRRFVDEVGPDVLCMDHYPKFIPGKRKDGRASYVECVRVMRDESLRAGIPYWNFFNTMPFGDHSDPTEGQLRWQIYATLAHGAKGVLWFCYYTPTSGEFPKGGAIIGRDDRPTRHYEQAKRINAELKLLGPTLMKLTSTRVTEVLAPDRGNQRVDTSATLAGGPILRITGDPVPSCLVGEFRHADGRTAVLLQNYDFAYTSWPTVEFRAHLESVREICKRTGAEIPVGDDSPAMAGVQLSLDAGDGRLFLMP